MPRKDKVREIHLNADMSSFLSNRLLEEEMVVAIFVGLMMA